MRILLVYPGQVCSTYDVALGYQEALTTLGHTVYPFNYHDWLKYHGGALDYWQQVNPNLEDKRDTQLRLASGHLIVAAIDFKPDVILIIHGLLLHPDSYSLLKRLDIPRAIILTECPYIDAEQRNMLEMAELDHIFVNDRLSLDSFAGSTYLPHSYSRLRHRPSRVDPEYATDVYFHGSWFPEREVLFDSLNFNGHKVRIVGVGWDVGVGHTQVGTPNIELVKYYQSTKIALNHHRMTTTVDSDELISGQSLGPRAYEIAACGAFQLCDDTRPELEEIFGGSVATYTDAQDLQDMIAYYLSHEAERKEMARAAFERVQPCSFYDRAYDIVLPILETL